MEQPIYSSQTLLMNFAIPITALRVWQPQVCSLCHQDCRFTTRIIASSQQYCCPCFATVFNDQISEYSIHRTVCVGEVDQRRQPHSKAKWRAQSKRDLSLWQQLEVIQAMIDVGPLFMERLERVFKGLYSEEEIRSVYAHRDTQSNPADFDYIKVNLDDKPVRKKHPNQEGLYQVKKSATQVLKDMSFNALKSDFQERPFDLSEILFGCLQPNCDRQIFSEIAQRMRLEKKEHEMVQNFLKYSSIAQCTSLSHFKALQNGIMTDLTKLVSSKLKRIDLNQEVGQNSQKKVCNIKEEQLFIVDLVD